MERDFHLCLKCTPPPGVEGITSIDRHVIAGDGVTVNILLVTISSERDQAILEVGSLVTLVY